LDIERTQKTYASLDANEEMRIPNKCAYRTNVQKAAAEKEEKQALIIISTSNSQN